MYRRQMQFLMAKVPRDHITKLPERISLRPLSSKSDNSGWQWRKDLEVLKSGSADVHDLQNRFNLMTNAMQKQELSNEQQQQDLQNLAENARNKFTSYRGEKIQWGNPSEALKLFKTAVRDYAVKVEEVFPDLSMRDLRIEVGESTIAKPSPGNRTNEDTKCYIGEFRIAGLFDGLGGHGGGHEASAAAKSKLEQMGDKFENCKNVEEVENQMVLVMRELCEAVEKKSDESQFDRILTTATVIKFIQLEKDSYAVIGNVGDSRAYLFKPPEDPSKNPSIRQLTLDKYVPGDNSREDRLIHKAILGLERLDDNIDKLVKDLEEQEVIDAHKKLLVAREKWTIQNSMANLENFDDDSISEESQRLETLGIENAFDKLFQNKESRNLVSQSLGYSISRSDSEQRKVKQSGKLEPYICTVKVKPGSMVCLTSDGVHDTLTDTRIAELLGENSKSPRLAASTVTSEAQEQAWTFNERAKPDDTTMVVLYVSAQV
jgi:serine/threonine protein phosphatase PrpC